MVKNTFKMIVSRIIKPTYVQNGLRSNHNPSFLAHLICLKNVFLRSYHRNVTICLQSSTRHFNSEKSSESAKIQTETPNDASSQHHHTVTILQRLHDLEESFRVRGHSVLRWGLSALVLAGLAIYVFREPLRENVADEVADVASRSLGKVVIDRRFARSRNISYYKYLNSWLLDFDG
mgnify:CR=1 FL=1